LQPERDVYSVAALGWYCLTGEAPARTSARPPLPLILPDVPAELAAALEAGLSEDRRRRPAAFELATAVYRSAAPLPVDLAGSVHPTVLPELLTRRPVPGRSGSGLRESLQAWRRRVSTSSWSGVVGARQVLPFSGDARESGPSPNTGTADRHPDQNPGQGSAGPAAAGRSGRHALPAEPGRPVSARHTGAPAESSRAARYGSSGLRASYSHTSRSRAARSGGPVRTSRILSLAAFTGVLAAAWWLAASGGPGQITRDQVQADRLASRQAQESRFAGTSEARIPEDVTARLGSTDPGEAVQGLASLRSLAFSSGRWELLDQVNVEGSTAAAADQRIAGPLREAGHVLAGFTSIVSEVRVHPDSNSNRALVTVTSAASSYEERDRAGAPVATGLAAPARQLRLVLLPVEGRWRITEILPGP
jgi:hypothetical protein